MRHKQYKFTLKEIAEATGEAPASVRRHKRLGVFKPDSLFSLAFYVIARSFINGRFKV